MFVVVNRVPVAQGWEQAFVERFRNRLGQVEKNAGFVRMEVLAPQSPGTPFAVTTYWESKDAFEAWVGSEDFKAAHANPLPSEAYAGEGQLEQFEVAVSTVGENA
jgi:heme-degrading monooxygenase HmoA